MESANTYTIAGLAFLGIAITLVVALITDFLYDGWIVWVAPGAVAVALAGTWFVRPLLRSESSGP